MPLHILVLGAAAGGGLPQWNCGYGDCTVARAGRIPSLTQSSLAVSADGRRWLLLTASPDVREQMATPVLHPAALRGSPVEAVVLTNGDVDHIAGLLTLRERTPFAICATAEIHALLRDNDIFGVLDPEVVARREINLSEEFRPLPGLGIALFPVPGKAPLYREGAEPETRTLGGHTVGVMIRTGAARALSYFRTV